MPRSHRTNSFKAVRRSSETANNHPTRQHSHVHGTGIKVFVSYAWKCRTEEVRKLAYYLRKQPNIAEVWLDITHMHGSIGDRMIEGIIEADLVMICMSNEYRNSENCMKELNFAVSQGKKLLPLNVQEKGFRPPNKIKFRIGDDLYIEYLHENHCSRVYEAICKMFPVAVAQSATASRAPSPITVEFKCATVPQFTPHFHPRPKDREEIMRLIGLVALAPKEGAMLIYGEGGCGKSTMLANLFDDDECKRTIVNDYKINGALWINCLQWDKTKVAFEDAAKRSFEEKLIKAAKVESEPGVKFEDMRSVFQYFEKLDCRILLILDDVFDETLLVHVRSECRSTVCCAVTRDPTPIMQTPTFPVRKNGSYRIDALPKDEIFVMLAKTFSLEPHLEPEQLSFLTDRCCNLPLIASLVACQFYYCDNPESYQQEYKALTRLDLSTIRVGCGLQTERDNIMKTVSNLFEFSVQRLTNDERHMYYAFVFFGPMEHIAPACLAVLWNKDSDQAFRLCTKFVRKGLLRRLRRGIDDIEIEDDDTSHDCFFMHQILHTVTWDNIKSRHHPGVHYEDGALCAVVRLGLVNATESEEVEARLAEVAVRCFRTFNFGLLERIVKIVKPNLLMAAKLAFEQKPSLIMSGRKSKGLTPFVWAMAHDNIDLIGLLSHMCPKAVLVVDEYGETALSKVVDARKLDLAEILAKHCPGAVDKPNRANQIPILKAISSNDLEMTMRLLKHCPRLIERPLPAISETILSRAAGKGTSLDMLRMLAALCPDAAKVCDAHGRLPLHFAIERNHKEVIFILAKYCPEAIALHDKQGMTALAKATILGQRDIVRFFVEKKPDAAVILDEKYKTPIVMAAEAGNHKLIKLFVTKCNPSAFELSSVMEANSDRAKFFPTPLAAACEAEHLKIVDYLAENFPNTVLISNQIGMNPLMRAVTNNKADLVKILAQRCPEAVSAMSMSGQLPLNAAADMGLLDIVEVLTGLFPHLVDLPDGSAKKPMILAAGSGQDDVVLFLAKKFPETIRQCDVFHGRTPLGWAAKYCHLDAVKLLVKMWPEALHMADKDGKTPIDHANRRGSNNKAVADCLNNI